MARKKSTPPRRLGNRVAQPAEIARTGEAIAAQIDSIGDWLITVDGRLACVEERINRVAENLMNAEAALACAQERLVQISSEQVEYKLLHDAR